MQVLNGVIEREVLVAEPSVAVVTTTNPPSTAPIARFPAINSGGSHICGLRIGTLRCRHRSSSTSRSSVDVDVEHLLTDSPAAAATSSAGGEFPLV